MRIEFVRIKVAGDLLDPNLANAVVRSIFGDHRPLSGARDFWFLQNKKMTTAHLRTR